MSIDWTKIYGDSLPRPEFVETDRRKWGPDPVTGDGVYTREDWDEFMAQFPEVERPENIPQETWNGLCAASKWHTANCPSFEEMTLEVEEL